MSRLSVGLLISLLASPAFAAPHIIAWTGNTKQANVDLGVNEIRVGCSGTPEQCLGSLDAAAKGQGVDAVTLAISNDPATFAAYALKFSGMKQKEPRLRGIGLDDCVNALEQWKSKANDPQAPSRVLRAAIENTKKISPDLKFGVTIYEDQLSSPLLADGVMPPDLRAKIDRVSLFLHFRANGPSYASYVTRAHELFPRAEIVAGVYPYDRADYLRCEQRPSAMCTEAEELSYFEKAFGVQMSLLRTGAVAGLEFYPGNFGTEPQWSGWSVEKFCKPEHRQHCVDTTTKMHAIVMSKLHQ